MSEVQKILSSIPLESVVRAHCTMTMMSVLTDVGLREDKAWSDDEQELLDKLDAVAERQAKYINAEIEAARAKDAELIQRLVDAGKSMAKNASDLLDGVPKMSPRLDLGFSIDQWSDAEAVASAAGFKPSEQ